MSSSRLSTTTRSPTHSTNPQEEQSKENESESSLNSSTHFPLPRTPLHTIPDPAQYQKETHDSDFENTKHETPTATAAAVFPRSGRLSTGNCTSTPRVLTRYGKQAQSESNSAHSTPANKSGPRVSLGGAIGGNARFIKGKELSFLSSRVSRGISAANSDFSVEVPHFELDEDPSFWKDHNVQVLIRIRPLNNIEKVSQGYGRCLKQESEQTLVWLGHPETSRFTYDHVACETISQEKLFKVAGLPMVENCMSGYNSCMFAYGQTGSGKTYTMMGEINQLECKFGEDCGITPRIFQHLFSRIRMEEESRRDEKLRFSCKCSFLEIYNEQITDLLEPSSTNLQLREDLNKGVYVENLTEYNVRTVNDVIKLLLQGAANRRMAATYMNSGSSRSHSVFTCVIESWWEKDSMNLLRFARLNLVDLAGSERQKTSGAEGDRLKEAANINKSLSTLGLVIMSLVDLAHGKHRHVPYRDSRLTFLLQDSLGGNSKTTIIANVSPSICSAHETLSTLKFAQRAKLIQNNAKVNEDASGDVGALQRQIQQLKDQLSFLMKHHDLTRPLSSCVLSFEGSTVTDHTLEQRLVNNNHIDEKVNCMETVLAGALRREKMAETAIQKLENEIEHVNKLACQREQDVRHTKMMLRFREEKIKQLELLVEGSLPADHFLVDENKALKEEIQLLQARIEKNTELTRFALENIKLQEQLQLFQNFYEKGEREILMVEISELRDQLLDVLEGKLKFSSGNESQGNDTAKDLEHCRSMNSKLIREVDELRRELNKHLNHSQDAYDIVTDSFSKDPEEIRHADKYSLVETVSTTSDSGDEMVSCSLRDDMSLQNRNNQNMSSASAIQPRNTQKELMEARSLVQTMESEQVRLIEEMQLMQEQNQMYVKMLKTKDNEERQSAFKCGSNCREVQNLDMENAFLVIGESGDIQGSALQAKLDKLNKDLEEARSLNCQYQEHQALQLSQQCQAELVCEEVEIETTRTILHLQEEVAALQLELNERLCCVNQENMRLRNIIDAKEEELKALCAEWERATLELTSFLVEGSKSLKDASGQIESIVCSFPKLNGWIGENVERAARACVDKEETILQLEKSLEDAQMMVTEMETKLNSLREATMALNECPQSDNQSTEQTIHLSMLLNEKTDNLNVLESELKLKEAHIKEAEKRANAAFLVIKWLSDCNKLVHSDDFDRVICISKMVSPTEKTSEMKVDANPLIMGHIDAYVELVEALILESENAINSSYVDVEGHLTVLQTDILGTSSAYMHLVQDLVKEIREMRSKLIEVKENHMEFQSSTVNSKGWEPVELQKFGDQLHNLLPIRDELVKINGRLKVINHTIDTKISRHSCSLTKECSVETGSWSADESESNYSTTSSDFLTESAVPGNKLDGISYTCWSNFFGKTTKRAVDLESQNGSVVGSESEYSNKLLKTPNRNQALQLELQKELDMAFRAFSKLYVHLARTSDEHDWTDCSCPEETKEVIPPSGLRLKIADGFFENTKKVPAYDNFNHTSTFLKNCEEAHATMKEADHLLNALLKANDNAKQLSSTWKQASEELMLERSRLIEENEQLTSLLHLKEGENKLLLDEISHGSVEVANSMSLLEGCFLQMQKDVEDRYNVFYSDMLSIGREILYFICSSRSSLEDICTEVMEKGFALCLLHHCLIGEVACKISGSNLQQPGFFSFRQKVCHTTENALHRVCLIGQDDMMVKPGKEKGQQSQPLTHLEEEEEGLSHNKLMYENLSLKNELERKEVLFKGLLFDFSLLQETASNRKDIKDETEKLIMTLREVRHELEKKTSQLDDLIVQHRKLEGQLVDTENALLISTSDLEQAKETIDTLSDQSAELRMLLKDTYLKKSEAEEQLEEQKELITGLEKEIINLTSSAEKKLRNSVESFEEELAKITNERDQLREEIYSLNDKLEMAYALADESEAIAVEARQESEASKLYAEQKEEEVKILEHSVEELESTINVLEKKVLEMNEEVERHRLISDSLELERQTLRTRLMTVENITGTVDSGNTNSVQNEDPVSWQLHSRLMELHGAQNQIRLLETEIAEKDKELKRCKEYISELVLHSEAQASQFQEKYKRLEAMILEVKTNSSSSSSVMVAEDKIVQSSMKTRGSSSPFRCIAGLVQQMNLEKDQELSMARLRIEELEAVLSNRQKEVCALNARLAAAESMTHDVIRDLLGVKLDMTNYANLIDQHQVQKLVEDAHQQTEEFLAKEHEILNLRKQINDLAEEREICVAEMNKKVADMLAAQVTLEQLQERDQLLSAQNEMLKMDKSNLLTRVAELDEMVKTLLGTQSTHHHAQQTSSSKAISRLGDTDLTKRLAHSEKLLFRVNDELAQYRKHNASHRQIKTNGHGLNHRKQNT